MAITKNPTARKKPAKPQGEEEAAQAFISGAAKKAEITAAQEDAARKPVMIRFDPALLERVDAAAKHRGISRSAWVHYSLSRLLDNGEG